jgi:hypothetical protein
MINNKKRMLGKRVTIGDNNLVTKDVRPGSGGAVSDQMF